MSSFSRSSASASAFTSAITSALTPRWALPILLLSAVLASASPGLAVTPQSGEIFTLRLSSDQFGSRDIFPEFGRVRNFTFEFDLGGPLLPDRIYGSGDIEEVRYVVSGGLSTNPPTPSGFPAFLLNRFPTGEGPITLKDWINQGSHLAFRTAANLDLADGLQLSELVPLKGSGSLLEIDAREFERLDRARYHPPQLTLDPDGTGLLWNSNNSSGSTGTVNPATGLEVDVDFGEEYITHLRFEPSAITLVDADSIGSPIPEPGTAILMGLGLLGLSAIRRD